MFEEMRRLYLRGGESRGIVVDAEGAMAGPDCVLVRRGIRGYRSLAAGEAAVLQDFLLAEEREPDWLFCQCRNIADALAKGEIAIAQILGLRIPLREVDGERLERLAAAASLIKANFNPDEPRIPAGEPRHGEWTTGGGAGGEPGAANAQAGPSPSLEYTIVGPTEAGSTGSSESATPAEVAPGGSAAGTTAAAGEVKPVGATADTPVAPAPEPQASTATGDDIATIPARLTLPGAAAAAQSKPPSLIGSPPRAGINLTLTQDDGIGGHWKLTDARRGSDDLFRDGDGKPIARVLPDGSILIEPAALPSGKSDTEDEPKLCPRPGPDHPGARPKDIAYQQYISMLVNGQPLGAGLAIRLRNPFTGRYVHFDDCRLADGTMIEAKGTGYADLLARGMDRKPWSGVVERLLRQADRQLKAAGARPVEWYFAEKPVADYMRRSFLENDLRITVFHRPMPGR
jgi:hypothetical protein